MEKDLRLKDLNPTYNDFLNFIDKLKNKEPFSFAHFNDGEASIMFTLKRTISRGNQEYSEELRERLKKSFLISNKNFYRGLPCPACSEEMYNDCINYLKNNSDIDYSITHACVFHNNYSNGNHLFIDALKKYNSITFIANERFNLENLCSGTGLDKDKCKYILVPGKNAFEFISEIENHNFNDCELVILLCGPVGRILAGEYFEKYPKTTFLCLGSYFDNILYGISYEYHNPSYGWCSTCCSY